VIGDARRAGKWIKSGRCGPEVDTNCVELNRDVAGGVSVRDSKGGDTVLLFADAPWQAFLARCQTEY
jgi:Domain of unknown function (DUF397)